MFCCHSSKNCDGQRWIQLGNSIKALERMREVHWSFTQTQRIRELLKLIGRRGRGRLNTVITPELF